MIVKYENLYELRDDDEDLKRRLKFTVGSYTSLKLKLFRRLLTSQAGNLIDEVAPNLPIMLLPKLGTMLLGGSIHVDKDGK